MHYKEVFNTNPVSKELAQNLQSMPKVEIHIHLEEPQMQRPFTAWQNETR